MTKKRDASRGKRLAAALAVSAAATAVGALLVEFGVRLVAGDKVALQRFRVEPWPNMATFRPSRSLPYEAVPNVPGFTNSLGMADRERGHGKVPGAFRVAVLSDSIGMYGKWTRRLETLLQLRRPEVEVWNWSIGGFGIKEYADVFEQRALAYEPDAVLIGFELFDLRPTRVLFKGPDGAFHCYHGFRVAESLNPMLYRFSAAYRLWMTYRESGSDIDGNNIEDIIAYGRPPLERILSKAKARGMTVRAVIFPRLKPVSEYTTVEHTAWTALRRLLAEAGVPTLDLSTVLTDAERRGLRNTEADEIHVNAKGDERVAGALAEAAREWGWAR